MLLQRYWINQPSTLQPLHEYHGKRVLAYESGKTIYFTEGKVHSMMIPDRSVLSEGWPQHEAKSTLRDGDLIRTAPKYPNLPLFRLSTGE